MSPPLLEVRGLTMSHGRRPLLDALDLQLKAAGCTLLTGENGAGKSTLLRILAGLEKPKAGAFRLRQGPWRSWRRARKGLLRQVMYLHQQPWMFDGSVAWNLKFAIADRPARQRNRLVEEALEWVEMRPFRDTPARTLSGGERQRIALARAWLAAPALMLLDEPTANLDQASRRRTLALLERLRDQGIGLMVASHDPHHFEGLADRHLRLVAGRLEPRGTPAAGGRILPIQRGRA